MDRKETFTIAVQADGSEHIFEIADYVYHDGERCKFKVYQMGEWVASFEPDPNGYLHICKNPGGLDEQVLHLVADEIEKHHFHQ